MIKAVNYPDELELKRLTDAAEIPSQGCNFTRCTFAGGDLSGQNFSGILDTCVFEECNLSLTSFQDAKLQGVKFDKCKLVGVDFTLCSKLGLTLNFTECLIRSCNFNYLDLKKALFTKCDIIETDFIGTNLKESNFSGTTFRTVTFHDTNLLKANFSSAQGYAINPLTNQIKGAVFSLPDAIALLECMGIKLQ